MTATYMIGQHLRSLELANRPEAVAERAIRIEACKRGGDDRATKFPIITPDNFDAANEYQNERIEYWVRKLTT